MAKRDVAREKFIDKLKRDLARVKFLSFPPQAQEKALAYLENLRRYLSEGE